MGVSAQLLTAVRGAWAISLLAASSTANGICARPGGWCIHYGSTYELKDCDGDGIPDPTCTDTEGQFGAIQSATNNCDDSWPNGECGGTCVPYSEEACRSAAEALGLDIGSNTYAFAGDYQPKGCYAYPPDDISFGNAAFYGTGGTNDEMAAELTVFSSSKYRPMNHDCNEEGCGDIDSCVTADPEWEGYTCSMARSYCDSKTGKKYRSFIRKCCPETCGLCGPGYEAVLEIFYFILLGIAAFVGISVFIQCQKHRRTVQNLNRIAAGNNAMTAHIHLQGMGLAGMTGLRFPTTHEEVFHGKISADECRQIFTTLSNVVVAKMLPAMISKYFAPVVLVAAIVYILTGDEFSVHALTRGIGAYLLFAAVAGHIAGQIFFQQRLKDTKSCLDRSCQRLTQENHRGLQFACAWEQWGQAMLLKIIVTAPELMPQESAQAPQLAMNTHTPAVAVATLLQPAPFGPKPPDAYPPPNATAPVNVYPQQNGMVVVQPVMGPGQNGGNPDYSNLPMATATAYPM